MVGGGRRYGIYGCPLCATALNGLCHRCLPVVVRDGGAPIDTAALRENLYEQPLRAARAAKRLVLAGAPGAAAGRGAAATRNVGGAQVRVPGGQLEVLFDDGKWRLGTVRFHNARTGAVGMEFSDPEAGFVRAAAGELQVRLPDG